LLFRFTRDLDVLEILEVSRLGESEGKDSVGEGAADLGVLRRKRVFRSFFDEECGVDAHPGLAYMQSFDNLKVMSQLSLRSAVRNIHP